MDAAAFFARLERTPDALEALLAGLPDAAWRWRPPEGGWSILEVVGHLVHEETDDFGARLDSTLADPTREWAPTDPEGAVTRLAFNAGDPNETLARFREERGRTLTWLRGLPSPRWDAARLHPRVGAIHAGDLLASWVAHDARHLQQIAKRLYALAARDAAPYSVGYAG